MCAKIQEIASSLFCRHEKEISFGFGKITFSQRHKTENYFKVALTQRKSEFIRFKKIHFLRTTNADNCLKFVSAP
jgi:hypothetical protein